jgi:hypothetical protein
MHVNSPTTGRQSSSAQVMATASTITNCANRASSPEIQLHAVMAHSKHAASGFTASTCTPASVRLATLLLTWIFEPSDH